MSARIVNVVLGAWLFVSAFVWRHSPPQLTNSWVVGVLCVAFALIAMSMPSARYLNTALSIWLFLSAFLLPRISTATLWNNVLVAIAIFVVSLVPSEEAPLRRPARQMP